MHAIERGFALPARHAPVIGSGTLALVCALPTRTGIRVGDVRLAALEPMGFSSKLGSTGTEVSIAGRIILKLGFIKASLAGAAAFARTRHVGFCAYVFAGCNLYIV